MTKPICVVTGGRGFVARHLVNRLLDSGRWLVRIMDLASSINVSAVEKKLAAALEAREAEYVGADLRDLATVVQAFENAEVVFHMAAADLSSNDFKLHYSVNVVGTSNVIKACIKQGVKKLIYTSSPSVVFDPINGIQDADESLPYPAKLMDFYSETKAQGEKLVLEANGKDGLVTCALRPSGIFGPGDRLFLPSIVAAARAGKLKVALFLLACSCPDCFALLMQFQIGNGENRFDWTYVENVVHAHICAEEALTPGESRGAAGKAFFITNCEPIRFWDFLSEFLERLGYDRPKYKLPAGLVLPLSFIAEWSCKQLAPLGIPMTQFTPSRIRYLTRWRTFNSTRAAKYLHYRPVYTLEEGIQKTVDAYPQLRNSEQKRAADQEAGVPWRMLWIVGLLSLLFFYLVGRKNVMKVEYSGTEEI